MMIARTSLLRRTAFFLALVLVSGCLSGCFGRGKDPQDETYDPSMDGSLNLGTEATIDFEIEIETEETTEPTEESTEPTEETEPEGLEGTVIGDLLNIRSGPGTNYGISGSLKRNDRVLILELKIVDDKLWGRTEDGWVSLNYILLDDPDQVPTVKETLKGIALEKLKLHEGPGSHYDSTGSIAKDSRLTITETCGKWGKTEKGWVDLEDVYIDGTEGPDKPVKGTVTGSEVNLRADPGTSGTIKGTVKKGDRVEILFQVKIGNMTWGCTKKGWISMDYVRLDEDAREDIVGSWYCYWDIVETNTTISYYSRTYTFKADGTYEFASYIIDIDKASGAGSYEIYASGSGNYTFDGSELVIGNRAYPAEVQGKELHITETKDTYVYVPGDLKDSFEYAKNQHKQDANDPAIVGSWYSQSEVTSDISVGTIYEFHADGTYDRTDFAVGWDGIGYILGASSGTYTFDGNTLEWRYGSYSAEIKNGKLHLTSSGNTDIYSPGGLEEAAREARSWYDIPDPTESELPSIDPAILGGWYCFQSESNDLYSYETYTFNANGTYTTKTLYINGSTGSYRADLFGNGTFTFDGSTLILNNRNQHQLKNGKLHIRYSGVTQEFLPGDIDDIIAEVLSMQAETEPTATEAPVLNSSIFGTWQELNPCNCTADQLCFGYTGCWTFNSDGTFSGADQERHYFYTPEGGAVYDDNTPGMGGQLMSGTYTFDGSTLVMTFTDIEWEDLTSPIIETFQVSISNGHMVMSGRYTSNCYKGNLNEAAARLFG